MTINEKYITNNDYKLNENWTSLVAICKKIDSTKYSHDG
jgi:hypothetical protein